MRRHSRSDTGEKLFTAAMLVVLLLVLAFWSVIGYVAYHFISKAW